MTFKTLLQAGLALAIFLTFSREPSYSMDNTFSLDNTSAFKKCNPHTKFLVKTGGNHLHYACSIGDTQGAIDLLRKDQGLFSAQDRKGQTPLDYACLNHQIQTARAIMGAHLAFKKEPREGALTKILEYAISHGYAAIALDILKDHPYFLHGMDNLGKTVLHCACLNGQTKTALKILESYPELWGVRDISQKKALDYACLNHKIQTALAIMEAHLEFKKEPREGALANILEYASSHGYAAIVLDILKDHPYFLNRIDDLGKTVLHYACLNGQTKTALEILESYPGLWCVRDIAQETALHDACLHGHINTARALLNEYPSLWGMKNYLGKTALDIASLRQDAATVDMLKEFRFVGM
jgi:ankyrin repeat protein